MSLPGYKQRSTSSPVWAQRIVIYKALPLIIFTDNQRMAFPYKKFSNITNIGTAGTEEVYSATIRSSSHRVVIKKLAADLRDYHGNYRMFDQNIKALKLLHHNNIIRVFDYGAYENAYYMSMEYIDGYDLEQLLHLPLFNRAIGLMIVFQTLNGLEYAHKRGVFHCDIKPGNILVSKNGRTKLSDFGLAHVKEHLIHAGTAGSVFTTPFYMPPEQASAIAEQALDSDVWAETTTLAFKETPEQHVKTLQEQTLNWDMWSVGVLLYRICTGRLPFYGKNLAQLANSIATIEPTDIHSLAPSIPSDLSSAIESCLIKDPQKRLASLDPVIASLQLYILSTGIHDYAATIKKHLRDCAMQPANSDEQKMPEIGGDSSASIPKPNFSLPLPLLKYWKTAGIAVSVLIIVLLGILIVANKSDKPSETTVAPLQKKNQTALPVNLADVPFEKAEAPALEETSSAHLPASELKKIDSVMTYLPVPEPSLKPAHKEKLKKNVAPTRPVTISPRTSEAAPRKKETESGQNAAEVLENQTGILKVTVDPPNAAIAIDGVQISGQVLTIGMQYPAGTHTISVTIDGYKPYQQVLDIEPKTTQVLSIALKQQDGGNGFIQVYTVPWSNVYVDGTMFGTTPTLSPISLTEGQHILILQRDGFLPVTQTVTVKKNDITRVQVDLVKQDSTVQE